MQPPEHVPGRERADVPLEKVTGYLLDLTHIDGRAKAVFLIGRGFTLERPDELIAALINHVTAHPIAELKQSAFGVKYVVDGAIVCPDGTTPAFRTIWIVGNLAERPRLVTGHPLEGRGARRGR